MPHACVQKLRKKNKYDKNCKKEAQDSKSALKNDEKITEWLWISTLYSIVKFKIVTKILVSQKGLINCINVMEILEMLKQKDGWIFRNTYMEFSYFFLINWMLKSIPNPYSIAFYIYINLLMLDHFFKFICYSSHLKLQNSLSSSTQSILYVHRMLLCFS